MKEKQDKIASRVLNRVEAHLKALTNGDGGGNANECASGNANECASGNANDGASGNANECASGNASDVKKESQDENKEATKEEVNGAEERNDLAGIRHRVADDHRRHSAWRAVDRAADKD